MIRKVFAIMPFCPQCGVDNPAAARFCDQCGAALIPVATSSAPAAAPPAPTTAMPTAAAPANPAPLVAGPITCPQCGATAIPGEAFCDNCGAPLNAPSRPAAQTPVPAYNAGVPPQPAYPAPQPANVAPQPVSPPPYVPPPPYTPPPSVTPAAPPMATPARVALAPSQLIVAANGAALPLPGAAQAIVGRNDAVSNFYPDIDLTPHGALDQGVGRRHLRLFVQGGQVMVEDLDSTNGSMLNGQKLAARQPQPLRDGDQLQVGRLILRFQA